MSVDILHRVGVRGVPPETVYDALTTRDGLASWWTTDTTEDAAGRLAFRFEAGGFDMVVLESEPGRRVLWEVVAGPEEWVGTRVEWVLRQDAAHTIVLFRHLGWAEPVEFMHHCSTKWASYLLSLKALLETGRGLPHPHDVKVADVD